MSEPITTWREAISETLNEVLEQAAQDFEADHVDQLSDLLDDVAAEYAGDPDIKTLLAGAEEEFWRNFAEEMNQHLAKAKAAFWGELDPEVRETLERRLDGFDVYAVPSPEVMATETSEYP